MELDTNRIRKCLKEFDFKNLFVEELGWNHYSNQIEVTLDGNSFHLFAVAEKHGMAAFTCNPSIDGHIPNYELRRKIEKQAAKSIHEHIIIYTDKNKTTQIWQWVKREAGKPIACREHPYHINQPGDSLIQKLQSIAFSLEEEESLTIVEVAGRARAAFDVERITKKFYDRFKTEHDAFLKFIDGIPDDELHRWYASVMLNRLMFIYFIQKKGFLDNDDEYLKKKLLQCKEHGKDTFYNKFLCPLFFEGFAKRKNERSAAVNKLLGNIPYLNGGLFLKHQIEELHGKHIEISDKAFEKLFDFLDQYQWHLDERPLRKDNEINPDVLGYIFEKYINQKQMGAYYTKEDITEYISKNTVIPFLFDSARQKCKIAFEGESAVWKLLQGDPDRYFYPAVKKGVELPLPAEIKAGIKDVSKRTEWNKPAPIEYALPTEIWREVVARRQRYEEVKGKMLTGEIHSINDLITYNLDIRQFAQDVIENSEGPELLRAFYHAIENVTVLDPTCGSGAFLFAALNILEPLYEACLDRMQVFVDELDFVGADLRVCPDDEITKKGEHTGSPLQQKPRSDKYSDFKKILKRVEEHPNLKYFIYKSIIVNNLYGVDIMEEAIEICKLRLFLKLVAQIEGVEHMEPLPDIDFNIRAGNTLVGFATYDEVKQAVTSKLDFENTMERIEERAEEVDRLFKLFHQQQTALGGEVTSEDKQDLRKRLIILEDQLNAYLAGEYGIDVSSIRHSRENGNPESSGFRVKPGMTKKSDKQVEYEKWLKSHQPFHWFIEFYGILKSGGFDVIIGNPPYVEYSKVKNEYAINGYKTEDCGNLYAYVVERSLNLLRDKGHFGMIVPISLPSTPRMTPVRSLLTKNSILSWCSNFADRPGTLFNGVHQKLSIVLCKKYLLENNQHLLFTTAYKHWYSKENNDERKSLMETFCYVPAINTSLCWLKSGNSIEKSIYDKLASQQHSISKSFNGSSSVFSLAMRMMYWGKSFIEPQQSNEYKNFKAASLLDKKVLVSVFNSTLYFWFWELISDGWHITAKELDNFLLDLNKMTSAFKNSIAKLIDMLMEDLDNKKGYVGSKQTEYEYYHKLSKPIIDEIDHVLAKHYGFTDEELDFIINYDIKYRMGRESEEGA